MTLDEYRKQVSDTMMKLYGITWDEATGDDEPLTGGMKADQTPEEFVRWWGEKYDLDLIQD